MSEEEGEKVVTGHAAPSVTGEQVEGMVNEGCHPEAYRALIRACLRELEEEREAVRHAADLERGDGRCLVSNAELLEGLLPETEGEDGAHD